MLKGRRLGLVRDWTWENISWVSYFAYPPTLYARALASMLSRMLWYSKNTWGQPNPNHQGGKIDPRILGAKKSFGMIYALLWRLRLSQIAWGEVHPGPVDSGNATCTSFYIEYSCSPHCTGVGCGWFSIDRHLNVIFISRPTANFRRDFAKASIRYIDCLSAAVNLKYYFVGGGVLIR